MHGLKVVGAIINLINKHANIFYALFSNFGALCSILKMKL